MAAKLHWINGRFLNRKVAAKTGRLHSLVTSGKSNREIVAVFYLRALGRNPTAKETAYWQQQIKKSRFAADRTKLLEDFVWSLLSCREFRLK